MPKLDHLESSNALTKTTTSTPTGIQLLPPQAESPITNDVLQPFQIVAQLRFQKHSKAERLRQVHRRVQQQISIRTRQHPPPLLTGQRVDSIDPPSQLRDREPVCIDTPGSDRETLDADVAQSAVRDRALDTRRRIAHTPVPSERTIHDLRHYAASTWLRAGIPVNQVSQWLGHANPNTTHLCPRSRRRPGPRCYPSPRHPSNVEGHTGLAGRSHQTRRRRPFALIERGHWGDIFGRLSTCREGEGI